MTTAAGIGQVGRGVAVGAVMGDFSQGSLESTTESTDLAVGGNGFFMGEAEGWEAGHVEGFRTAKVEVEALYLKKLGGLVSLLESMGTRLEAEFSELVALNQPRMLRLWDKSKG